MFSFPISHILHSLLVKKKEDPIWVKALDQIMKYYKKIMNQISTILISEEKSGTVNPKDYYNNDETKKNIIMHDAGFQSIEMH